MTYIGSPPRVRGKAPGSSRLRPAVRITPACAGKSDVVLCFPSSDRDHPRVCGEKVVAQAFFTLQAGSPPRVRGKVRRQKSCVRSFGITPACAGKSAQARPHRGDRQDHPRVCGEKPVVGGGLVNGMGSPPRVRGKVHSNALGPCDLRITPACAGKRNAPMTRPSCWTDHPRVCGEKQAPLFIVFLGPGSPPRVRGKVLMQPGFADALGITPACAGKSRESDRPDAFT